MSNPTEVTIPDIGDIQSVDVIEVLVVPGDSVQKEDPTGHARKRQSNYGCTSSLCR